jgi:uncharacterized protein YdaU (DUF1376 family)
MNKPPAFQFYPADFLGGTGAMTQAEVGAYILLLCHQWNHGSIPVQPERQQNIAKGQVSDYVLAKFKPGTDGELRNERLEQERQKQADYREKQRQKGLASGIARAKTHEPRLNSGSTTVEPSGEPKGNSLSSSSYPIKTCSTKGARKLSASEKTLADMVEKILGNEWVNDAGKWLNRITGGLGDDGKRIAPTPDKVRRVFADTARAVKDSSINTTPARYAENTWKEFK